MARQAWALCEAALEACVGELFFPGIEGTYDIARMTTYHPEPNLRREFRVDRAHPAGFLTEKMAHQIAGATDSIRATPGGESSPCGSQMRSPSTLARRRSGNGRQAAAWSWS